MASGPCHCKWPRLGSHAIIAKLRQRPLPVIALLALAMVLGAGLLLFAMRHTDWRGDEYTYHDCAVVAGNLLAGRTADFAGALQAVIGTGWFMGGICALAAPPLAIDPQLPYWALRGWMWLASMALFALLAVRAARRWGRWAAVTLLVFPGIAPLWQLSAQMLLPDLPAGLLVALATMLAIEAGTGLLRGEMPGWRKLLAMQACLVAALYLRGPTLLCAVALNSGLLVLALAARNRRSAARVLLAALAVPVLLAPWSIAVSRQFDAPVLTTTNLPLVLADTFGDPARTCRGPCGDEGWGDIWPAWHWGQAEAKRTGRNALAVEREMSARSLAGLTVSGYLARVRANIGRYMFDPGETLRTQMPYAYAIPAGLRGPFYSLMVALTLALYVPFTLALLAANVLPLGRTAHDQVAALALKVVSACLFMQPFVHKSSGRYWTMFAPFAAIAVVLLVRHWNLAPAGAAGPAWVTRAQGAYGVAFVAVMVAIVLA